MKKIEVNHTPNFANIFTIAFVFLWVGLTFISLVVLDYILLPLSGVLFVAIIIWEFSIAYTKTTVEYDTETIHWKWLFLAYTVNFSEMQSVHYTITSERTRGGYTRRFEIVFNIDDKELKINDNLKTEDI